MGLDRRLWATLAAIYLASSVNCAAAQHLPPAEAFGNLPAFSRPRLSPDGTHYAALQSFRGKPAIVIYKLFAQGDPVVGLVPSSDCIITYFQWVKSDRLVFLCRTGVRGPVTGGRLYTFGRSFAVGRNAAESIMLMKDQLSLSNNTVSRVTDIMLSDNDHVLAPLYRPNYANDSRPAWAKRDDLQFRLDLLKVNVRTGNSELLFAGSSITNEWYSDGHGKVIARVDQTKGPLVDHLKRPVDGNWENVASFDATGDRGAAIYGVTADGKSLAQRSYNERGIAGIAEMDPATGKRARAIYFHPTYDIDGTIEDEWTGRVIGASYMSTKQEYVYFSPEHQALQRGLEQAFPGLSVHAVSETPDRRHVIVSADGPKSPLAYYYLDRTTRQASLIAGAYPDLKEADLGEVKQYSYKARDGLDIDAYLTLPPGKSPKGLPTVVMPHGGPDSRDAIRFDWWAQFLANRGYVVLQPNFRGSSGYGRKFTDAGLQQWGRKMQDDISDGVKKLIADGIADPKRICIVGSSYGGYAALAGAAFTPDLYACVVSVAGVSDLPAMITSERIDTGKGSDTLSFWFSRMGSIYQDRQLLHDVSPAKHADMVKAPVLLLHGEDDSTVRIGQSLTMQAVLKRAGKKVEFIRFPGDDHYLALSETRTRMLKELERFLAEHTGSGQQSPAQRQVE